MNISTVSTKYQATVPEEVRKALELQIGDKLLFKNIDKKEKKAVIEVVSSKNIVDKLYGSLKTDVPYIPLKKAREIAGIELGKYYAKKYKLKKWIKQFSSTQI